MLLNGAPGVEVLSYNTQQFNTKKRKSRNIRSIVVMKRFASLGHCCRTGFVGQAGGRLRRAVRLLIRSCRGCRRCRAWNRPPLVSPSSCWLYTRVGDVRSSPERCMSRTCRSDVVGSGVYSGLGRTFQVVGELLSFLCVGCCSFVGRGATRLVECRVSAGLLCSRSTAVAICCRRIFPLLICSPVARSRFRSLLRRVLLRFWPVHRPSRSH